ncbi:MAG: flagellar hook-basal body complex protein FliE [Candidatus Faecalibacterium intestinavium]|uniref:Flagellar hook-basal body complex protein FliE n=1 Tax=Candidatus Faecalibacterium intestinavium TaxID=2838580 RepID=A0A9E2NR23_9FIRM|nr:flagellar hook-basal body complex protein FliE [Candidatus Faecalibacterium intestinavium]
MELQKITPILSVGTQNTRAESVDGGQSSMFADVFQSMVDNVKETDAAKNEAYYALATGQLDNPATAAIAATQAELSVSLLVQMRNRALEAYNELMRISL